MPAVERDFEYEQGTAWSHGWRVTYNGEPIDATWTAVAQIRKMARSTSPLLYTLAASVDADGNVVIAVEDPAETEDWTWEMGYYDVKVTSADGLPLRVAEGTWRNDLEVSRV